MDELASNVQFKKETENILVSSPKIDMLESLCSLYRNLLDEIYGDTEKVRLFEILNQIIETVEKACGNFVFTIENHEMFADISKDVGDFNKSMSLLKHARLVSSMIGRYDVK